MMYDATLTNMSETLRLQVAIYTPRLRSLVDPLASLLARVGNSAIDPQVKDLDYVYSTQSHNHAIAH